MNFNKSELIPQQVFNFVGYCLDFSQGPVKPTQGRGELLTHKIQTLMNQETCSFRQFLSLIWLLTTTEKQVRSGRLYMRPIQWHPKNHRHVPESLDKIIPLPKSLHPHLRWWLDEDNVLYGQPLHRLQLALQLFTDLSNKGLGAHLGDCMAKSLWSKPEGKLCINFLELKAVMLAVKKFEYL